MLQDLADRDAEDAADAASAGDFRTAVARAHSAVGGYRELVSGEPDIYHPDLALTLDALGGYLAATGQVADALSAAEEAVDIFRSLVGEAAGTLLAGQAAPPMTTSALPDDDGPEAFLPYLAAALSNLSVRQHEAAQSAQMPEPLAARALESAREAVSLYRGLAGVGHDAQTPSGAGESYLPDESDRPSRQPQPVGPHTPGLAAALANYTNRLDESGHLTEALAASAEAVGLAQQLAAIDPEAHLPALAQGINNRAVLLRASGQTATAIATARQAVNLYRKLAADGPRFAERLAMVLGNLANMLSEAGRGRNALPVAQEVVAQYRSMNEAAGQAAPGGPYDPPLAASLNNLAVRLVEAGRTEEALAATREATSLYRQLARRDPQVYLGDLAAALANLGSDLADAGLVDEALSASRESVDVTRRLAFGNRPVYLPQLAQAVNNLAVRMQEAGRSSSALASAREAVRLYQELATRDPDLYADPLARTRDLVADLAGTAATPSP